MLRWTFGCQVGCMRQVLGPGALGRPRGIGWRGRWEGGSGWVTHVNPWLIHVSIWQNPLQYCKVISLQLIKKIIIKTWKGEKKKRKGIYINIKKKECIFESLHSVLHGCKVYILWCFINPVLWATQVFITLSSLFIAPPKLTFIYTWKYSYIIYSNLFLLKSSIFFCIVN